MTKTIFTINPGSTSTKISLFENTKEIFSEVLRHPVEELDQFASIGDQYEYRKDNIIKFLESKGVDIKNLTAISARGGLLKPMESGTYRVNEKMLDELQNGMSHAASLAGIIAYNIAKDYDLPSFIVDPPVVDEMDDVARITGLDGVYRTSKFHALNQKAIAKRVAKEIGKPYAECNFVVAHIGGGVSVAAHKKGRVVDVNDALDGDGPMSPNRAGALPVSDVIKLCFSGKYTEQEAIKLIQSKAGLLDILGTCDARDVEKMIEQGDEKAKLVYEAMAYQTAKSIASCTVPLRGDIDGIILTGGIAYSKMFSSMIEEQVGFLGKFILCPGEDEMLALAEGALRVLDGEEEVKEY